MRRSRTGTTEKKFNKGNYEYEGREVEQDTEEVEKEAEYDVFGIVTQIEEHAPERLCGDGVGVDSA